MYFNQIVVIIVSKSKNKINSQFMKLHSKYAFDNTIKVFFIILSLLISIVWFSKTISFVRYITDNGVETSQFLFLFILILPAILVYMIPISLFIACGITINKMLMSNEIAILKSSGLSDFRIGMPIIKISLYMTFFCLVISMFLMPYSNKKLSITRQNLKNNYANISFNEGVFENMRDVTIFVAKKTEDSKLYGIILNDNRNKNVSLTITSKEGRLGLKNEKLFLYMTDGTIQRYNKESAQTDILEFDSYIFNLVEEEKIEERHSWKARERYIHELLNPSETHNEEKIKEYTAQIHKRIIISLFSLTMTLISLMFLLKKDFSRRGNFYSILYMVATSTVFLAITLSLFRISEINLNFVYLNYLNLVLFTLAPLVVIRLGRLTK